MHEAYELETNQFYRSVRDYKVKLYHIKKSGVGSLGLLLFNFQKWAYSGKNLTMVSDLKRFT